MNVNQVPLGDIAHARSGDKGNHANVAVLAYTSAGFAWLREHLTADAVHEYFRPLHPTRVVRYEAPNVLGLNFVLYDVLAGGASRSLRADTQGKALGQALHRPTIFPMPALAARLAFGEMADELLLASQRAEPAKLSSSGYRFRFPTLRQSLESRKL